MVYAPSPLPWVPGSGSELRPRHPPQLVSKHKHEMASAADSMRLTVYLRAATVRPPAPSSPAVPRGGRSNGRRPAAGVQHRQAVLEATSAGGAWPGGRAARRSRRRYVRVELVLAVGDLIGTCRCTHEWIQTDRQVVVLAVFD